MTLRLPLTGRDPEMQHLKHLISEVRNGRGSLTLLSGESGAGKTALLEAVTRAEPGLITLAGHCPGPEETPVLGPWKEVVAGLSRLGHNPSALPHPFGRQPATDWSPREVAASVAGWLSGHGVPLMVLLEDIHWADASSLELLRYLTPGISSMPLLLVATYRSDEVHRLHPLWTLLPHLQRAGAGRLHVDRLSLAAVRELVAHSLPSAQASADVAGHLCRRTGGNAFFVRELLAEAVRTGELPHRPEVLPETIQQAIDTRLSRLTPGTLIALQAAALIGERFPFDLLTRVLDLPEEAMAAALEEALNLRIICCTEEAGESFAFDHALVREALLSRLIPIQRRRWHRQIADSLLAAGSLDMESLAFHLSRARDGRAVEYLMVMGDRTLRQGMLLTAHAAYERALDLLAEGDARRPELLLKIGQTLRYADVDRANLHWDEAVREAGVLGVRAAAVWARTQALSFQTRRRPPVREAEALALIEEAEMLLGDSDYQRLETDLYGCVSGYPRALGYRAEVMLATGQFAEAGIVVDQIKARTAPGSNPFPIIFLKLQLAWVAGQCEAYLDLLCRMAAAQYETRYYRNVVDWENLVLSALLVHRADRPDDADVQARRVQAMQAEARERSGYTVYDGFSPNGFYQFMRGDWEGARRNLLDVLRERPGHWGKVRPGAAQLQLALGDPAAALETLAPLFPVSPEVEPQFTHWHMEIATQCQRASALLMQGELARARAWLEAADRWMAQRNIVPFRPVLHLTWADYWDRAGDRVTAEVQAWECLRWALSLPDLPRQIGARRLLGRLAAQEGRAGEAEEQLQAALDLAARCQFPYELALTQVVRGEYLPQLPGARQDLDAGRETLFRLGAVPVPECRTPAPETLPDGLTQREAEIVRLVARGLTDKQVGAELFISPRTVDGHLRRIFVKLGVSSRTALGAYAARRGLDR